MSALKLEADTLRKVLQQFNSDLGIYINDNQRYKLGRVLTIIDAAISDPEQRKAIKDLVNSKWWNGNNQPRSSTMTNPHTDIRAICELFGFELYPKSDLAEPMNIDNQQLAISRYKKVALEEK